MSKYVYVDHDFGFYLRTISERQYDQVGAFEEFESLATHKINFHWKSEVIVSMRVNIVMTLVRIKKDKFFNIKMKYDKLPDYYMSLRDATDKHIPKDSQFTIDKEKLY